MSKRATPKPPAPPRPQLRDFVSTHLAHLTDEQLDILREKARQARREVRAEFYAPDNDFVFDKAFWIGADENARGCLWHCEVEARRRGGNHA